VDIPDATKRKGPRLRLEGPSSQDQSRTLDYPTGVVTTKPRPASAAAIAAHPHVRQKKSVLDKVIAASFHFGTMRFSLAKLPESGVGLPRVGQRNFTPPVPARKGTLRLLRNDRLAVVPIRATAPGGVGRKGGILATSIPVGNLPFRAGAVENRDDRRHNTS
jgi:hypothetical protein